MVRVLLEDFVSVMDITLNICYHFQYRLSVGHCWVISVISIIVDIYILMLTNIFVMYLIIWTIRDIDYLK